MFADVTFAENEPYFKNSTAQEQHFNLSTEYPFILSNQDMLSSLQSPTDLQESLGLTSGEKSPNTPRPLQVYSRSQRPEPSPM